METEYMKKQGEVMLVNDDAESFAMDVDSDYVDKTQLIAFTNSVINKNDRFICVSRPRRFGKSMAVHALAAYYSKGIDSHELFKNLKVSQDPTFETYINQFNTLYINLQSYFDDGTGEHFFEVLNKAILNSLSAEFPSVFENKSFTSIKEALRAVYSAGFGKFVVVIDEWDMLLRDYGDNKTLTDDYINLLRSLFKDDQFSKMFALVYMTGILPIKRYNTQSALNNFKEYTMLNPGKLEDTFGFTEDEVKALCEKYNVDFKQAKMWYDGYHFRNHDIYNPYAVINAVKDNNFTSYWSGSSTTEPVIECLKNNFMGLKDEIIALVSGINIGKNININKTKIIPEEFVDADDVLVYLVHLGYLSYNLATKQVSIPNQEIRSEFEVALKTCNWTEYNEEIKKSDELIEATLGYRDVQRMAKLIGEFHQSHTSILDYNNEEDLKYTVLGAFFSAIKYYNKPLLEQRTGKGFADIIYLPNYENYRSKPALIIELKNGHSAEDALNQIKDKNYVDFVKPYAKGALLIGINYDPKTKEHSCIIEEESF